MLLQITPCPDRTTPKKKHTPERKMVRNLPGSPEASCKEELHSLLDIESGDKEEKKSLGARTLERLSLRIFSWGYHVQRILRHFPVALLFLLMLSNLYPDVTLPLCIGFTIFIVVTIVDYIYTPSLNH